MRRLVLPILLVGGCGTADPTGADADDDRIACRIGDSRRFERVCTVERIAGEAGTILIVRKPDGGFRRLLATGDGRGVVAADGAERAEVTIVGDDRIEVAIGGDTFRLPATVRQ